MLNTKWIGWIACALAVGFTWGQQRQPPTKYGAYYSAPASQMDVALLRSNLEIVRENMGFGFSRVYFDRSCDCFMGQAVLTSDDTNQSIEQLRNKLLGMALVARASLETEFPEMPQSKAGAIPADRNFIMNFKQMDLKNGLKITDLAVFREGKITFR